MATIKIDTSGFRAALNRYRNTTRKSLPEILNQRALNVAGRAFDGIPPRSGSGVDAQRARIKKYMGAKLSPKRKLQRRRGGATRGPKPWASRLERRHLIAQARRARRGRPGLYGKAMKGAAGRLSGHAQTSAGFLKSIFLPVLRGLQPYSSYKFPFAKTQNISRWPKSAGYGSARPAREGFHPRALLNVGTRTKGMAARPKLIVEQAFIGALAGETAELTRHVERKLAAEARKEAGRRVA